MRSLCLCLVLAGCANIPKVDDTAAADLDGDGWTEPDDCDDGNAAVNPAAAELCNGTDDDCDGTTDLGATDAATWYADLDGDTFGDADAPIQDCAAPAGTVADATDCDDNDATIHPGGEERCGGADEDCDGETDEPDAVDAPTWYADADADGHGDPAAPAVACVAPKGSLPTADDCDDRVATTHPGAPELCNGVDDDCDHATADAGTVSLVGEDGTVTDVTSLFTPGHDGAPVALDLDPGDYLFCDGTWPVSLRVFGETTLRSLHGAEVTTLDGADVATIITTGGAGTALRVEGLTLTRGTADAVDVVGLGYSVGGAIDCQNASTIALEDAVVAANTAEAGAGIFAYFCALDLVRTRFADNLADRGGGLYAYDADVRATECTFEANVAAVTGGAMEVQGGAQYNVATLTDTVILGNAGFYGGGLAIMDYASLVCAGTTDGAGRLVFNEATYGGAVYYSPAVGSTISSTGCDWGTPEVDDNLPQDLDRRDSGAHDYYSWDGVATFACTESGCG